jgi:ornithine carbamoyltransferase
MIRHVLSITDFDTEQLHRLVDDAVAIARGDWAGRRPLADRTVGIYFRKTSTRTRTSFSVGAMKLGASIIAYGPNDLQLATGETVQDTARVLASYLDVLVIRTNESLAEMRELAAQDRVAIINAMSDNEHPTQALADLATLQEHFGRLSGLHVLFLGEGNSTAASLALATSLIRGMKLTLVTPPDYALDSGTLSQARALAAKNGAEVEEHHDAGRLPVGVDAVYTSRWLEMGVPKQDAGWVEKFKPYTVTAELMNRVSKKSTVFLHDLPAMRGYEVVDEVLDGPQSIAFRQAFHKMTSAMSALAWCVAASDVTAGVEQAHGYLVA